MSSTQKEVILENPFHPLDLSAHDLLTIKKKFAISGQANRNPKQQLPIENIAQLISSLNGCKPSYVQKCMSQAIIKQTISWKDFLGFLDQQSEARYKLLDWLLHEKSVISYRFVHQMPFRQKIQRYFDNITHLNFITLGQDRVMLTSIDGKKINLICLTDNKFEEIDSYIQKNKKVETVGNVVQVGTNNSLKESQIPNRRNAKKRVDVKEIRNMSNKSTIRNEKNNLNSSQGNILQSSLSISKMDDESYYKKERKNIHALFNLFNELPVDESRKIAQMATKSIRSRSINSAHVVSLKDTYSDYQIQKKPQTKQIKRKQIKPLDKARKNLSWLYKQKAGLSYNPYKYLPSTKGEIEEIEHEQTPNPHKKIGYDRKEKQYLLQSNQQTFCPQLSCIGIVYYNLEICLIKVAKQYNKIVLQEEDKMKMITEKDHKKNEAIQGVDFYYHRITNKWFLLVLVRNQFKNQFRSQNDSFVKGYEIQIIKHEWKDEKSYKFVSRKEEFIIDLGKNEIIKLLPQPEYGLHFITHTGKYLTWKEDYIINKQEEIIYWKKDFQEKFKGGGISFSCIYVSAQLNKALLGTIKGTVIIYDLFTRQYKIKKLSVCTVLQIKVFQQRGYILYENQKLIIYDILRDQEIQVLNVKNDEKLHDKVKNFQISQNKIYAYGTCIRVFEEYIDQSLQHQKFKMENIYTWRISKLNKAQDKSVQSQNFMTNKTPSLTPKAGNVIKKEKIIPKSIKTTFRKTRTSGQLVIRSDSFIAVLTEIQQVIFFSTKTLQVKFTIILDIPHDEKVMKMALSPDEKLLAILLYNQQIFIFNIYTQELLMEFASTAALKYTCLQFLDQKNEYMLATGTENGKIVLIPYQTGVEKETKTLQFHSKPISSITLTKDLLITTCQGNQIAIWQLPFNILRHDIKNQQNKLQTDFFCQSLGSYLQNCFLRTLNGLICEINTSKGQIKSYHSNFSHWLVSAVDPHMGYLIGINKKMEIQIYERVTNKGEWTNKMNLKLESKSEIIGVAVIPSEKAIFFTQAGLAIWDYRQTTMGKFRTYVEEIP